MFPFALHVIRVSLCVWACRDLLEHLARLAVAKRVISNLFAPPSLQPLALPAPPSSAVAGGSLKQCNPQAG